MLGGTILGPNYCLLRPSHLDCVCLSLLASLCALPSSLPGPDPFLYHTALLGPNHLSSLCSLLSSLFSISSPFSLLSALSGMRTEMATLLLQMLMLLSPLFLLLSLAPLPGDVRLRPNVQRGVSVHIAYVTYGASALILPLMDGARILATMPRRQHP